jgi:hypothetical protein
MKRGRLGINRIEARDPLDRRAAALYLRCMTRVFDMDDRARLPWRFFGAMCSITARL